MPVTITKHLENLLFSLTKNSATYKSEYAKGYFDAINRLIEHLPYIREYERALVENAFADGSGGGDFEEWYKSVFEVQAPPLNKP